jgi:heme/copper-type cytochrome/quinol oxidase subunit 1
VAEAVRALVDETGWTTYTPLSTERRAGAPAMERLAKLCHL